MKPNLARTFAAAGLALVLVALGGLPAQATTLQQTHRESAGVPVGDMLNADGRLNLGRAPQGALDLRGWDVRLDTHLGPVFSPALTGGGPWSWPAAMGLNGIVAGLAQEGNNLYAGGAFNNAGGDLDCDRIGIWTGSAWDCPNGMSLDNEVRVVAYDGSNLYAGGIFADAGGDLDCDYIGIWTGSAWDCPNGMSLGGDVEALAYDGSNLYAGGQFANGGSGGAGDPDCDYVGIWTGTA